MSVGMFERFFKIIRLVKNVSLYPFPKMVPLLRLIVPLYFILTLNMNTVWDMLTKTSYNLWIYTLNHVYT